MCAYRSLFKMAEHAQSEGSLPDVGNQPRSCTFLKQNFGVV